MQIDRFLTSVAVAVALSTLSASVQALVRPYPTNVCVSSKQKAAGAYCKAVLNAWGAWERSQDGVARDSALGKAALKLATAWTKAETAATNKGVDCSVTTIDEPGMQGSIDTAVTTLVDDVNTGLNLATGAEATCGRALLRAAASDCSALLHAEGTYVRALTNRPKRDTAETKARTRLTNAVTNAITDHDCPTQATATDVSTQVDSLVAAAVTNTTMSPNVDDTQFTTIAPTGVVVYQGRNLLPLCSRGDPYYFFVKRGTVNKLVMYYEGGGACWDYQTCSLGTFNQSINPNGGDNPQNGQVGFGDLSNPNNPFKDWNIVFTSYCTGDIHFGNIHQDYTDGMGNFSSVNHLGYQNARVVEKWAREHFVNPDEVFVTGSSAGAYGAFFNAPVLEKVWPDSKFSVFGDAGNGVITSQFITQNFPSWNFIANVPTYIPGVLQAINSGAGIPAYTQAVAAFFPNTTWAHYATAYDGGLFGQTGFYNVMLNPGNPFAWLPWWNATCAWHDIMRQQAVDTFTAISSSTNNYRYYIGRGSRHTGWGSNTVVYNDDAIGVTPALKDWTTSMRNRDAGWVNVECTDCTTLLPGDPQPSPLAAPFTQNGADVDIVCP